MILKDFKNAKEIIQVELKIKKYHTWTDLLEQKISPPNISELHFIREQLKVVGLLGNSVRC